jgi:hypothetical protein
MGSNFGVCCSSDFLADCGQSEERIRCQIEEKNTKIRQCFYKSDTEACMWDRKHPDAGQQTC